MPESEPSVRNARDYFDLEVRRVTAALRALRPAPPRPEGDTPRVWPVLNRAARAAREAACERAEAAGVDLPIEHAARVFRLDEVARDALVMALAVEVDPRVTGLVRELGGSAWPTLGLIQRLADLRQERTAPHHLAGHLAVRDGLFELVGDGPFITRAVRAAAELVPSLVGDAPPPTDHLVQAAVALPDLIAVPRAKAELARWADDAGTGTRAPLLLAGPAGSGRRLWAAASCAHAGLALIAVDLVGDLAVALRSARRLARWHRAAIFLRVPPGSAALGGPEATAAVTARLWHEVDHLDAPVIIAAERPDADVLARSAPNEVPLLHVGELPSALRRTLWTRLLADAEGSLVAELASDFPFRTDQIARAAHRANRSVMHAEPIASAVRAACRDVGASAMSDLAERLTTPFVRDDLVVPDRVAGELDLAIAWARERARILDDWGFGERLAYGRGISALFAGKPGTGKTMAARVLAAELGAALYRVDLARVVSKYIGETEKHLGRLFDEAHAAGAILFFDEADALFGRRGEVREAHDRWANIEVGYLLQRMEQHEGITVLATNRHGDLDEAFSRRFQVSIVFPVPGPAERVRLWRQLLPAAAPRDPDLPLDRLASDYELTGGDIQNAVMAAAVIAAAAGRPIGEQDLYRGVHRVLVKNGAMPDDRLLRLVRTGARGQ